MCVCVCARTHAFVCVCVRMCDVCVCVCVQYVYACDAYVVCVFVCVCLYLTKLVTQHLISLLMLFLEETHKLVFLDQQESECHSQTVSSSVYLFNTSTDHSVK